VALDLDPAGNTATSLGPIDDCTTVSPGTPFTVDVVVNDIPPEGLLLGFEVHVLYDETKARVTGVDNAFLLAADPDSSLLNINDPLPDSDGEFVAAAADVGDNAAESGAGILSRITFEASQGASGAMILQLATVILIAQTTGNGYTVLQASGGTIVFGGPCQGPSVTPTPLPGTPTLPPSARAGAGA
jgi:hypothetical protein